VKRFVAMLLGCAIACAVPAAASTTPPQWGGVPVLMYHRVDAVVPRDPVGRDLTITPEAFSAQLQWLRSHRIQTMTAAALVAALRRGERPQRSVVLTFDDGYDDAATTALPLLRASGAVGTFYISSGFVGTPRHLSWRQIRTLQAAGMEIACHGTFHLDLSTLDLAGQTREAKHCVDSFARYLGGFRPTTYAYPAGKYDATTFEVLARLRIEAAFTEHPGAVRSLAHPFALPRRRISSADGLDAFGALATP
jgi:peptidoglycan/xylan/chitin deacetylase (PgdA/CDA1 family)